MAVRLMELHLRADNDDYFFKLHFCNLHLVHIYIFNQTAQVYAY